MKHALARAVQRDPRRFLRHPDPRAEPGRPRGQRHGRRRAPRRRSRPSRSRATPSTGSPSSPTFPGGDMRFANESTFERHAGPSARRASRIDWVKNFAYPAPRTFTFSEIVTPEAGYVLGVDSNGRNAQNLKMSPPAHSMSGYRLATTQRELAPRLGTRCCSAMQRSPRQGAARRRHQRPAGGLLRRLHRRLRSGHRPAVARAHARLRQHLGRRHLRRACCPTGATSAA